MKRIVICLILCMVCVQSSAVESDKYKHFGASAAIAAGSMYVYKDTKHPVLYSFLSSLAVGVAKEMTDKKFDNGDFKADVLGALTSSILTYKLVF